MQFVLKNILHFMPLIFGIGFLGPLLAEIVQALGWHTPLGLAPLTLGLIIGGAWGGFAQFRGRWI
ncbi:hypothetical protein [Parasphingorhabdus cellanae]|uniref:Uncharacterized protein n=1 Tax=Parasphingorhabdus cellanae TaxID=2806553 RepID=A0ABX7TBL7_9SPHN|nr:hypothetical protein [Parasphingorhabdus cellanae]QTD57943.1 hypothetical protein J4G78_12135 [Parasphingorhabdus cellanae]